MACRYDILIFFGERKAAGFEKGKDEDAGFRRLDDGRLCEAFYGG